MTTKPPRAKRDADLDERPFGDSHFGASVERQRARAPRQTAHAMDEGPVELQDVHALHDGFFDDVPFRGSHRKPTSRRPPRV
ncbi:MAG: hypothetical protein AB1778_00725 [Candidatus Bipolaricaulota bacterium]